jgi:maltose O-acetyltransferase
VGERTIVSAGVIVHADERVRIGAHVGVGERTSLIDSDHDVDGSGRSVWEAPVVSAPIEVGDGVLIGANAVVLRGSRIGAGAVLGAGSVLVGEEQPPGWLWAGTPARAVRSLRERQSGGVHDKPSR